MTHTQLSMAHYFNDATVQGGNAPLPWIMDLIDIIKYRQWHQLPQILPHYTLALGPGSLASGNPPTAAGCSNSGGGGSMGGTGSTG
jgi:uncharacterized membrane protein YgcG